MTVQGAVEWFAAAMIVVGTFFFVVGTLGLLRLPDFFARIHAIGKCDTLGAMLMLGGLGLHYLATHHGVHDVLNVLKVVAIILFIFLANPTATHAFARSALRSGLTPWVVKQAPTQDTVPQSRIWKAVRDSEGGADA